MQQMLLQYASKSDLQAHVLSDENHLSHSGVYGRLRLKHPVSERSMTLAEGKRPEVNRLIELRPYALQCHTR